MVLWIDAVCLNQADIDERNAQVRKMDTIYRDAEKVIGWLGKKSQTAREVGFPLLQELTCRHGDDRKRFIDEAHADPKIGKWQPLFDLLDSLFWSRLWIVQEMAINPNVLLRFSNRPSEAIDLCWLRDWHDVFPHIYRNFLKEGRDFFCPVV